MSIRVLFADDHAIVRQGLRALFEDTSGVLVVGEAKDGNEAIALAKQFRPDVVVMDINMPLVDGIKATQAIRHELPETNVVILSMHDAAELVHQALQCGARGYILKASVYDELEEAIRKAAQGQLYHSEVVDDYLERFLVASGVVPVSPLDQLTAREREVLELLVRGYRSSDVAEKLFLSKKTVDKYRANVMKKLKASSPIELGRIYAHHSHSSGVPSENDEILR